MAIRKKRIQVVLSESEMKKFKEYAESQGVAMSEILRDYIKLVCSSGYTAAKAEERIHPDG